MKPVAKSQRPEKTAALRALTERAGATDYCFLLNYGGLSVAAFSALRDALRGVEAEAKVVKNTLLAHVARECGWDGMDELLRGPTALVTGRGDPAEVAKVLVGFLKKNETASVKGGRLDRAVLGADEVKVLANLPSKDILRSMLLGTLLAPATSLVRVFAAPLTGVLYVLKAKAEADGGGESAA